MRPGPWYHGSPHALTSLRQGSMVTPFENVAEAFSHKPSILHFGDDQNSVVHDGQVPGFLYQVSEPVTEDDLQVLAGTGQTHWEIQRELQVALVCEVPVTDPPQLTGAALEDAQRKRDELGPGAFFEETSTP